MAGGGAQLARDLTAAADELARGVDRAGEQATQLLATAAQRGAPRRSGYLAGSIDATPDGVIVSAPYGRVIHDGWAARHIKARPFLTDAADRVDWSAPYAETVSAALDGIANNY